METHELTGDRSELKRWGCSPTPRAGGAGAAPGVGPLAWAGGDTWWLPSVLLGYCRQLQRSLHGLESLGCPLSSELCLFLLLWAISLFPS